MFAAAAALAGAGLAALPGDERVGVSAPELLAAQPARAPEAADASAAELAEGEQRLGTPRHVRQSERRYRRALARARARRLRAERRRLRETARALAVKEPPYWRDAGAAGVRNSRPSAPADAWLRSGRGGWVDGNGYARPPHNAPAAIKRVIYAGNEIARSPYKWGGGHGQWLDKGYDCSGSISYALAAGGMLGGSQNSTQLMRWGVRGQGRWLTVYSHEGHVFMVVAGLRFDTSGANGHSRWQLTPRPADGFRVRHYPGL